MARDRILPAWVMELLVVKNTDKVIEIGSGPGIGLEFASLAAKEGLIVGVDPSEVMLAQAKKHNHYEIEQGHIELYKASVDKLPFNDGTFDIAFTINSLHLWDDSIAGLQEIGRVLRDDGRIGVAISRFSNSNTENFISYLMEAGFQDVQKHHLTSKGTCYIGRKTVTP